MRIGNRISTVGPFLGWLNLHTKFPDHHKNITACDMQNTYSNSDKFLHMSSFKHLIANAQFSWNELSSISKL